MDPRFIGHFDHTLDTKNRVTVPKRFLEAIDGRKNRLCFVVTLGRDHCLNMFTDETFDALSDRLDDDWLLSERSDVYKRNHFGHGEEIVLDGASRLNIPKLHKEWAGIEKEVTFVGVGRHIEVWSTPRWRETAKASLEHFDEAKPVYKRREPAGAEGSTSREAGSVNPVAQGPAGPNAGTN